MSRAEHDRLNDEGEGDEQVALAEAVADERRAGDGYRPEERLLPESRLQRVGDRGQPREVRRQHVRMDQRIGRRPPAEEPRRVEIQQDVVGEEDRDQQIADRRAAEDRR